MPALLQIKTFNVIDYKTSKELDEAVNNCVIETYKREGNYPQIETNSKFISVICVCRIKHGFPPNE
jgi:hypothetical protein